MMTMRMIKMMTMVVCLLFGVVKPTEPLTDLFVHCLVVVLVVVVVADGVCYWPTMKIFRIYSVYLFALHCHALFVFYLDKLKALKYNLYRKKRLKRPSQLRSA